MYDKQEKEYSIKLSNCGFNKVLREQAFSCAAPIYWFDPLKEETPRILANGTFFFLKIQDKTIGITANHVYEGYQKHLKENPNIILVVGETTTDLNHKLIWQSQEHDIVAFKFSTVEVQSEFRRIPHEPVMWPPPNLKQNQGVLFVGFPGEYRKENGWDLTWIPFVGETITKVASEGRVIIQIEREYLIDDALWKTLPPNSSTGGISGGPLFALWQKKGIVFQQVAGVTIECNSNLEITRFVPISLLETDLI